MSVNFSQASSSTGSIVSISFDGSNGIATSAIATSNGIFYSSNAGASWTQSNISTGNYFCGSISGQYAVAGNYDSSGIYYSSNYGATWSQSSLIDSGGSPINPVNVSFYSITLKGQYGIAGTASSLTSSRIGIYYTSDYGVTWTQSASLSNVAIYGVYLNGTTGIACAGLAQSGGLYYSTDRGVTWTKSANFTSSGYNSLVSNGSNITLAGGSTAQSAGNVGGIILSTDLGVTWTSVLAGGVTIYGMSLSGTNAIAASEAGLYYSSNSGATWTKSASFPTLFYYTVHLSGTSGIAGGFHGSGIHISTNSGVTWSATNVTSGNFRSSYIVNNFGVIGSTSTGGTVGIYTSASALCYNENTEILCLSNGLEKYVKISDINVGDIVKTYKNDYKKVKYVRGFDFAFTKESDDLNCLYKMKNTDLIVSGGHSLLVDSLTDEQIENNMKYNFSSMIEDKHLLLACSNENFEKITENKIYKLYHLVLENDDEYRQYGIWVNHGILSETCSENTFKKCLLFQ